MSLFEHLPVPQGEQSRDSNHEYTDGAGDAVLRQAAPLRVNFQIDEGAEHVDPVAQAENSWDIEGGQADGHNVNHRRQNAGHGEGKGDAAKCSAESHAVNFGCFFERGVHGAEHLGRQDERQGGEAKTLNETHADGSRDIDGSAFKPEEINEPPVQYSDSRVRDERPAHGGVNSGYQQT